MLQVISDGDGKTVTGAVEIDALMATLSKEGTKFDRKTADGLPPISLCWCSGAPGVRAHPLGCVISWGVITYQFYQTYQPPS